MGKKTNNKIQDSSLGNKFESYVTDPTSVSDNRDIITEIYVKLDLKRTSEEQFENNESKKIKNEYGNICHVDFCFQDKERAKKFYGDLFGWTFTEYIDSYFLFASADNTKLQGGFEKKVPKNGTTIVYVNVKKIEETVEKSKKLGGKQEGTICTILNVGRTATMLDSEGNLIGLYEAAQR